MSETTTIEWRPVPTHSGYVVNHLGQIKGPSGKVLRPMRSGSGHLYVLTPLPRRPRKLFVHRAIVITFRGPAPSSDHEVRHLDGNPENNHLSNLAWGTRMENVRDKSLHGTERYGEHKPNHRLTADQARAIRVDGRASRIVGRDYGVSHTAILRIRRGDRWRAA